VPDEILGGSTDADLPLERHLDLFLFPFGPGGGCMSPLDLLTARILDYWYRPLLNNFLFWGGEWFWNDSQPSDVLSRPRDHPHVLAFLFSSGSSSSSPLLPLATGRETFRESLFFSLFFFVDLM